VGGRILSAPVKRQDTVPRLRTGQIIEIGGVRLRVVSSDNGPYIRTDKKPAIQGICFVGVVPA
jgi:hypothetical protein